MRLTASGKPLASRASQMRSTISWLDCCGFCLRRMRPGRKSGGGPGGGQQRRGGEGEQGEARGWVGAAGQAEHRSSTARSVSTRGGASSWCMPGQHTHPPIGLLMSMTLKVPHLNTSPTSVRPSAGRPGACWEAVRQSHTQAGQQGGEREARSKPAGRPAGRQLPTQPAMQGQAGQWAGATVHTHLGGTPAAGGRGRLPCGRGPSPHPTPWSAAAPGGGGGSRHGGWARVRVRVRGRTSLVSAPPPCLPNSQSSTHPATLRLPFHPPPAPA